MPSIDIAANTRAAQSNVKDLGKAIENVADSLDDVARDGAKSGDKLEKTFKDLAREANTTGKKVGADLDEGFKKAGRGADDFKQEAASTAKESAASFDGSAESIGDAFQEIAANAFEGFGPAASIAGLAVAAGMGTAISALERAGDAADEAKESTYEFATSAAAAGGYLDYSDRINELTGSIEGLKKVQDIATISGWEQQEVVKALATGDGLPALTAAFNEGANSTTIATNRALELQGALDGTAQGFALGATGAELQAKALYDLTIQTGAATGEVDDLGNAIYTMPDGKQVVVDAETAQAYVDVDTFEKLKLSDKSVALRLRLDTSEYDRWTPPEKRATVRALRLDEWQ